MYWLLLVPGLIAAFACFIVAAPESATASALSIDRKRAGLKLKRQELAGFSMPYLEGGEGEVLVLIHGFGGDKDNFTRLAGKLTKSFRVIIPDLPGFGDATRDPSMRYRMSDQVERLQAFCRALRLGRMILGGNSMGGFIAAQYASRYPDEVVALWLIAPAGVAAAYDSPIMRHYNQTGESPLLVRKPDEMRALVQAAMSKPPYFPGFMYEAYGRRGVNDYPLHATIMKELTKESPPLDSLFVSLPTPALIVWGTEDKVLNPQGAETFQRLIPNSQVILMPGIGHVPMMEAPAQTARDFLTWARGREMAPRK